MLHNSVNYVNECYQIHKRLWFLKTDFGIFWVLVDITFLTFCLKKLSITGVCNEKLDFFKIFVIMVKRPERDSNFVTI